MKRNLAFVLGGGGARGAMQVGAIRALLENGLQPDMLVGTSIGAVNATYLAVNGFTLESVSKLEQMWYEAVQANLLPSNYLWLTVRHLFDRKVDVAASRMEEFYKTHGISDQLCYGDLSGIKLIAVTSDLNTGKTKLYGTDPKDSVLEGLLASSALPPWVMPIEKKGALLIDGGATSPVPIEPAMELGASEIIALDLGAVLDVFADTQGFGSFMTKLLYTADRRHVETELKLADARHINVRRICLYSDPPVPLWDFSRTAELIEAGYQATSRELKALPARRGPDWWNRLKRVIRL